MPEGSRILLGGSTLFSDGGPNPRPLAKAGVALERLRTGPAAFNLLLTDRTMPQLTGPQLIAQARAQWPDLPVLLMSGLESPPDKDGGGEDVHRLVTKPIDIAELSRAVRQAMLTKPNS